MSTPAFRNPLMPRSIVRPTRAVTPRPEPPAPSPAPPVPPPPVSPTLSEADAARYINVSVAWLRKSRCVQFRDVMDGPTFVRLGVKRVAYLRADLDAWLNNHRQQIARPDVNFTAQNVTTNADSKPSHETEAECALRR